MRTLFLSSAFFLLFNTAYAQVYYCAGDGKTVVPVQVFSMTIEEKQMHARLYNILLEMLGTTAIQVGGFELRPASNLVNAQAEFRGGSGKRIIWYNPIMAANLYEDYDWLKFRACMIALFAHEIGHLMRSHTTHNAATNIPSVSREESADNEAGWWLRHLKVPLEDAKAIYNRFPWEGNASHPPRETRVKQLENGFYTYPSITEILSGISSSFSNEINNDLNKAGPISSDNYLVQRRLIMREMGIRSRELTQEEKKMKRPK